MITINTKEARLRDQFIQAIRIDNSHSPYGRLLKEVVEVYLYHYGRRYIIAELGSTLLPYQSQLLELRRRLLPRGSPTQQIQMNALHKIKEIK
jgi:hypothetical protein